MRSGKSVDTRSTSGAISTRSISKTGCLRHKLQTVLRLSVSGKCAGKSLGFKQRQARGAPVVAWFQPGASSTSKKWNWCRTQSTTQVATSWWIRHLVFSTNSRYQGSNSNPASVESSCKDPCSSPAMNQGKYTVYTISRKSCARKETRAVSPRRWSLSIIGMTSGPNSSPKATPRFNPSAETQLSQWCLRPQGP